MKDGIKFPAAEFVLLRSEAERSVFECAKRTQKPPDPKRLNNRLLIEHVVLYHSKRLFNGGEDPKQLHRNLDRRDKRRRMDMAITNEGFWGEIIFLGYRATCERLINRRVRELKRRPVSTYKHSFCRLQECALINAVV